MRKTTRYIELFLLILVTTTAIFVFVYVGLHALVFAPEGDVPLPKETSVQIPTTPNELPTRLQIPSLTIDASVQHVGVNGKGAMGIPSNYTDVAWYKQGPAPGQRGSAVIDGHVDNGLGLSGVFKHLSEIKKGADIYIERADATRLHFVVTDVETYDYKDVPLEALFNRNDAARLNLITCGGSWVKQDKTYDQRVVVYSTLVAR